MSDEIIEVLEESRETGLQSRLDGVVIGVLTGFDNNGAPVVVFPGNEQSTGRVARSSTSLSGEDVGREVALLFEQGDPERPLVIGRIQHPEELVLDGKPQQGIAAEVDGERIEFRAKKEIVLRCGKASITLTRAGKILIRGTYVLSRSSGANRIRGGSVQIN